MTLATLPTFLAVLLLGIAAFAEAVPLLGLLVPGQTLVITAGFLIRHRLLAPLPTIIAVFLGAFFGDLLGFTLGTRSRTVGALVPSRFRARFDQGVTMTRKLFCKHPGKTLIIGRFNSLTRAFSPYVAGLVRVQRRRFLLFNLLGALSWTIVMLLIGFLLGTAYLAGARTFGLSLTITLFVGLAIIALVWLMARRYPLLRPKRWLLILNLASLFLFVKLVEDVVDGELITRLDLWVNQHVLLSHAAEQAWRALTLLGNPFLFVPLVLLTLTLFLRRQRRREALLFTFTIIGGFLLLEAWKLLVRRARPPGALLSTYSFPSGHAMMLTLLVGFLLLAMRPRWWQSILGLLLIFLVGVSRLALHVHWMSDVLAGWALGAFWLTLVWLSPSLYRLVVHRRGDG